jgi:nucleotide-binding universal stress UspA family protein
MTIKDILVHLDDSERSKARLDIACCLAKRHAAHLKALYVIDIPPLPALYGNPNAFVDVAGLAEMTAEALERARSAAKAVEQAFWERLRRDDIRGVWHLVEDVLPETAAAHARCADLMIVGQASPGEITPYSDLPGEMILSSGRPVLAIPYVGRFPEIGGDILIGWKSTREAARAVNDAIPLLQQARSVKVLAISSNREWQENEEEVPAADIALHLARHGVKAEATHTVAAGMAEGEILLNMAADTGADLIVVGGYGHSRMREIVFGGVTRTLLSSMTVPVLFSH